MKPQTDLFMLYVKDRDKIKHFRSKLTTKPKITFVTLLKYSKEVKLFVFIIVGPTKRSKIGRICETSVSCIPFASLTNTKVLIQKIL